MYESLTEGQYRGIGGAAVLLRDCGRRSYDSAGTTTLQRAGTADHCGTSRYHIINNNYRFSSRHGFGAFKGVIDVLPSILERERCLSPCEFLSTHQSVVQRDSCRLLYAAREKFGLVVPPLSEFPSVQWNRHEGIGDNVPFEHKTTQAPSKLEAELLSSGVLQRVGNRLKRTLLFKNEKRNEIVEFTRFGQFRFRLENERKHRVSVLHRGPTTKANILPGIGQESFTDDAKRRIDEINDRIEKTRRSMNKAG